MKYYTRMDEASRHWEIGVVREMLFKEPNFGTPKSVECRERLVELYSMRPTDSAGVARDE
jgi:hypothetical protein